ncbi:hypothetical protein GCM10027088_17540 [Nocardia goodfellowii]
MTSPVAGSTDVSNVSGVVSVVVTVKLSSYLCGGPVGARTGVDEV